jgi:transposase
VDGAPNGISVPRWSLSKSHLKGAVLGKSIQKLRSVTRLGLDLAKKVFQVHADDANGKIVVERKLARGRLVGFFSEPQPRVVAMEACSSAHHWGRRLLALGSGGR